MHNVAEHHTKEEGEGDDGGDGRVQFLVGGCTISINNLLENAHKFTILESSRLRKVHTFCTHFLKIET